MAPGALKQVFRNARYVVLAGIVASAIFALSTQQFGPNPSDKTDNHGGELIINVI